MMKKKKIETYKIKNQKKFDAAVKRVMNGYDSMNMIARFQARKEVKRLKERLKFVNAGGYKF